MEMNGLDSERFDLTTETRRAQRDQREIRWTFGAAVVVTTGWGTALLLERWQGRNWWVVLALAVMWVSLAVWERSRGEA
jgi:hypothetical protein